MGNRILISATLIAVSLFIQTSVADAQVFIDVESGVVFTGYNNVRIPGDEGTLFSLKTDLDASPAAFFRLRVGYTIRSRHAISLLYAPLNVKSDGTIDKQIYFEGVSFPSNSYMEASYKFNSYRITYRYDMVQRPKFEFGLGLTVKIRDAEIALQSEGLAASKANVGLVPLINFRLHWNLNENFGILFEGDALGVKQGRAEDLLLAGTYKFSDHFLVRCGYRVLEGGADGGQVYNFAFFHYASFGIVYTF